MPEVTYVFKAEDRTAGTVAAIRTRIAGLGGAANPVRLTVKPEGIAEVRSALAGIPDEEVTVSVKAVGLEAVKSAIAELSGGVVASGGVAGMWAAVKGAARLHGEAADVEQMEAHLRASLREEISDEQLAALSQRAEEISSTGPMAREDILLLMAMLARNNRSYGDLMSSVTPGMVAMALSTATPGLTPQMAIDQGLGMSANIATDVMDIFGLDTSRGLDIADLVTGFTATSKADLGGFGYYLANAGALAKGFGVSFEDFVTAGSAAMPFFKSAMDMGTSGKVFFQRSADFGVNNYDLLQRRGLILEGSERYDEAGDLIGYRTTLVDAATGAAKPIEEIGRILHETFAGLDPDVRTAELGKLYGADSSRFALAMMESYLSGALLTKRAEVGQFSALERADLRYDTTLGAWATMWGNVQNAAANVGRPLLGASKGFATGAGNVVASFNRWLTRPEQDPNRPWAGTDMEATLDMLTQMEQDPVNAGAVWDRIRLPSMKAAVRDEWYRIQMEKQRQRANSIVFYGHDLTERPDVEDLGLQSEGDLDDLFGGPAVGPPPGAGLETVAVQAAVVELDTSAVEGQVIKLVADVVVNTVTGERPRARQDGSTERNNAFGATEVDSERQHGR